MRAVQTDTYETFLHTHQCVIDSRSRTSCKKCRFAKCIEVGMKVSYVKVHQEECQKILVVKNAGPNQEKTHTLAIDFAQEKLALEDLFELYQSTSGYMYFEGYAKNPSAFLDQVCQVPIQQTQNVEEFIAFMDYVDIMGFSTFALNMTKKDGVIEDAQVLFKHNYARLQTLFYIACFVDYSGVIEEWIKHGQKFRQTSWNVEQLMLLHDSQATHTPKFEYDMYFASPWASTVDIEYEHRKICQEMTNWYCKVGKNSPKLDKCLYMLVQLILLYNSDGIEDKLKHASKIKELQANYSNLLHRYLKSQHNPAVANILLGKGLMLVHDTQRAYDFSTNRLNLL